MSPPTPGAAPSRPCPTRTLGALLALTLALIIVAPAGSAKSNQDNTYYVIAGDGGGGGGGGDGPDFRPIDMEPHGQPGQLTPGPGPAYSVDLGPQRPQGQFPPGSAGPPGPPDLGPQRPHGQFPPVFATTRSPGHGAPADLGPHRPNGQLDPNGPKGSNGDLGPHRPQGLVNPNGPPGGLMDLGPHRPFGQFPPQTSQADDDGTNFRVHWNVPTFMCHRYGFQFANLSGRYGVVQNDEDVFRGSRITILYDPGLYPAFVEDDEGNQLIRNGGVPQEGNITLHLIRLERAIKDQVPEDFNGLGVIDFEAWRPVWVQNWGTLTVYQTYSIEVERKRAPKASQSALKRRAKTRFEEAAKVFFLRSLELAKKLRPNGKWGYYAFPYCFNQTPNQREYYCSDNLRKQNSQIQWLWDASTALYPSVYLSKKNQSDDDQFAFLIGRLEEAKRVADGRNVVYPYLWDWYQDNGNFISDEDLKSILTVPRGLGLSGAIMWGSSGDLNTRAKCSEFNSEVDSRLGPAILKYSQTLTTEEVVEYVRKRNATATMNTIGG